MNPIARAIDSLLGWLKWPVGVVAFVFLPGLVYALYVVLRGIGAAPGHIVPFALGATAYTVVFVGLARKRVGFWTVVEHELTHAVFAWLTFHRVVGFAAMRSGGHVRYVGRGNWLIAIAPYFFPTFTLIVIAVLSWAPPHDLRIGGFVLGVFVGHHVLSTWLETHRHQTDLREVGWLWSWLFLPAVNAFVLGIVLAYAAGTRSLTAHLAHVREPTLAFFHMLVKLLPAVVIVLAVACRPAPAPSAPSIQPPRAAHWVELAGRYEAARKAHDSAAAERLLGELDATVPANPQIMFARVKLAAERGDTAAAIGWLAHYAAAGLVIPPGAPPPIAAVLADPRAASVVGRLAENARPHGDARIAFALPTGDKLFEDVVWDPAAKVFYASSVRDRRVYAVTPTGELRPLTAPEADGIGVSGLALAGKVLWLSTAALPPVPGYQAGDDAAKPGGLVAVDVTTGREARRLALRPDGAKHALTDLAVMPGGDVLASDATAGRLYIARHDGTTIEPLATDFMSPQTPAPRDAAVAYVPDYSLGIARVEVASGAQSWLAAPPDVVLTGIDGMYLAGGALIAIQNGVQPPRVMRFALAPDGRSVTAARVIAAAPDMGEPTHAAIVDGTLWFLGNSGWSRFDDTGNVVPDSPPDRPAVWRVAL